MIVWQMCKIFENVIVRGVYYRSKFVIVLGYFNYQIHDDYFKLSHLKMIFFCSFLQNFEIFKILDNMDEKFLQHFGHFTCNILSIKTFPKILNLCPNMTFI